MAFHVYSCPKELGEGLPTTLAQHGFVVRQHEGRLGRRSGARVLHSYSIHSRLGRIYFDGFIEAPGKPYCFFLTGNANPFRWLFDLRLYREVEQLLLSQGAQHLKSNE